MQPVVLGPQNIRTVEAQLERQMRGSFCSLFRHDCGPHCFQW
jgi:hypothetical protein